MESSDGQTQSQHQGQGEPVQLCADIASESPTAARGGAGPAVGKRPEGLPPLPRRARDRALLMLDGQGLSGPKLLLLANVSRLQCRFEDADARLRKLGPVRADDEPRVLLNRLLDLEKSIRDGLAVIFPDGDDATGDLLEKLTGAPR